MSHAETAKLGPEDQMQMGELAPRLFRLGLGVGIAGLVVSLILVPFLTGGLERFMRAYLFAFIVVLTISLGGLFFTILQHLTRAGWSVTVRRLAEGVAGNLMWIWVLFIPILIAVFATDLYHWMHPAGDEVLEHKSPYFFFTTVTEESGTAIPWFWLLRAVVFFGIWAALARFFVFNSIAQDHSGDLNLTHRMQWYAPIGMLLFALTQTFASLDWIMSLEPHWFSTIYPVYFFAGSACGFFSILILTAFFLQQQGKVQDEVSVEHYHDLGKLLFAFGIVFWAYIAYSQYMLLWYANLTETTGWYLIRGIGAWGGVSLLLLFGHFLGPFIFLLSRHPKRMKQVLAVMAGWMLLMHMVDVYWLVMPQIPHETLYQATSLPQFREAVTNEMLGFAPHLVDLICLVALLGFLAAGTAYRLGKCSLVPRHDPRLHEALAFHNI